MLTVQGKFPLWYDICTFFFSLLATITVDMISTHYSLSSVLYSDKFISVSQWMHIYSENKMGLQVFSLPSIYLCVVAHTFTELLHSGNLSTRKCSQIERQTNWKCSRDPIHCRSGLFRSGCNRCTELPKWFMRPLPESNENSTGRAYTKTEPSTYLCSDPWNSLTILFYIICSNPIPVSISDSNVRDN